MDRRAVAIWLVLALVTGVLAVVLYRSGNGSIEFTRSPQVRAADGGESIAPYWSPAASDSDSDEHEAVTRSRVVVEDTTTLDERPSVVIRVVDDAGEPIPDSPIAWGLAGAGSLPTYRASTDPRGEVALDASELDALFDGKDGSTLLVASLEAWVAAPDPAYRVERSREAAEAKGIEIRIPAAARIVVEVLEAEAPLWESVVVELHGSKEGSDDFVLLGRETAWFGRCEFTRVQPGLQYFAKASFAGLEEKSDHDPDRLSRSGISPPLRIGFPALSRIHFGVLDPAGEPLRDAVVSIARRGLGPAPHRPIQLQLDGDGRGRVAWPIDIAPVSAPRLVEVSATIGERTNSASISLPDRLPRGRLDLGFVQLCADPVGVEGRAGPFDRR